MATKTATKKPPTKGDATRKLTKLQREGAAALRRAEAEAEATAVSTATKIGGRKKPKKSLAYRASHKIKAKHKVLRPATYVTVGAVVSISKLLKVTGIGLGKATKWGSLRLASKVKTDVHKRKWVPEGSRPAGSKWFKPTTVITCCGKDFDTIQALNAHHVKKHKGQPRAMKRPLPKIQKGHTSKTAGKVIVRPKIAGGGRHRERHNLPDARRVSDLVAAHEAQIKKIGDAVMATENAAASLMRAAREFGDSEVPRDLATLRSQVVGFERAMLTLGEAVNDYAHMLKRPGGAEGRRGANIDPALVNPFMLKAQELIESAGSEFTRFIAAFDDIYALHIAAARGELSKPNIDLSKTG